jgi:hypothetical protein
MIQLTDAAVVVNNEAVGVNPNSVEFDEGRGEQTIRAVSIGEGKTEQVFANNLETNIGGVKFTMPTTVDNVSLALSWKTNKNRNVVAIAGSTDDGTLTRTFTQAALTANYKIPVGTEADIEIEFMANQPI